MGAGLLLRYCLLLHGVVFPEIAIGPLGKPCLRNNRLQFNLSHSEERVMCAISEREVGCDVEKVIPVEPGIAERLFSREECRWIALGETQDEQNERFFRIWTQKESFAKMTGLGMDYVASEDAHENDAYYIREYDRLDGYRYAVCSREENIAEELSVLDLADVVACLDADGEFMPRQRSGLTPPDGSSSLPPQSSRQSP